MNSKTRRQGRVVVVGLGPGTPAYLTPEAEAALREADVLFGYSTYLNRVPERSGQRRHASDNREELDRARSALEEAAAGSVVAVVSGGDPGVFGMAAAVCEAVEHGQAHWRNLQIDFIPGVTAVLAVAARVGAPLGHDFCVISLSDNLKPWSLIEQRLAAAAANGFVIGLYNPSSRARPWQLERALSTLATHLPAGTPVVLGSGIGRETERVTIATLAIVDVAQVDMSTCIIVGSAQTRIVQRDSAPSLVYTPRCWGGH